VQTQTENESCPALVVDGRLVRAESIGMKKALSWWKGGKEGYKAGKGTANPSSEKHVEQQQLPISRGAAGAASAAAESPAAAKARAPKGSSLRSHPKQLAARPRPDPNDSEDDLESPLAHDREEAGSGSLRRPPIPANVSDSPVMDPDIPSWCMQDDESAKSIAVPSATSSRPKPGPSDSEVSFVETRELTRT